MKLLKKIVTIIVYTPLTLIAIFIVFQIFGMCVNHIATKVQTNTLKANLKREISDIEIIDVHFETVNTSGTGNHVDCLSEIVFSTQMQQDEIEDRMSEHYEFDEWYCYIEITDDGHYKMCLLTYAPFVGNIEGH